MPGATLIAVEGVLRKAVGGYLIQEGVRLYKSLAQTGAVILATDTYQIDEFKDWAMLEGLVNHDEALEYSGLGFALFASMLRSQRYWPFDLVVTADPEQATRLIWAGLNTLLFTHAEYAQPSWRPDAEKGVQPWDSLAKQVADNARIKAKDARLKAKDD